MTAPRQITRWSLRMLADIQLNPRTAQWLVDDVALRLDRQNAACCQVKEFVEMEKVGQTLQRRRQQQLLLPSNPTLPLRELNSSNKNNSSSNPRVIRAVLHDFRDNNKRPPHLAAVVEKNSSQPSDLDIMDAKLQSEYAETLKSLQNLKRLHADTHRLCEELHPYIFQRWSKADQHLVFTTMEQIRARHANSIETWADIVLGLRAIHHEIYMFLTKHSHPPGPTGVGMMNHDDPVLFHKIDSVLQGRWGIQLLCDHYVALYKGTKGGAVRDISILDMLEGVVMQSRQIIEAHYQEAPEVVIASCSQDVHVTAVDAWLYHALVELLKNAMTATLKKHMKVSPVRMNVESQEDDDDDDAKENGFHSVQSTSNGNVIPPVTIQINREGEYVIIDILDQGTGLLKPKETSPAVDDSSNGESSSSSSSSSSSTEWAFGFTNSSCLKRWDRLDEQQSYAMVRSPASSLGVGLNVSRTMMRHFGGNVELLHRPATPDMDMGCTARVWLNTNTDYLETLNDADNDNDDDELETHGDDGMKMPKAIPM